jgi:soluble lytic murein transglycosylase-like protein
MYFRYTLLPATALAWWLLAPSNVSAQVLVSSTDNEVPSLSSEQVFEPVRPAPAPKVEPVQRVDAATMVTSMTNSVLNAGSAWDPSLNGLTTGRPEIDLLITDASKRHGVDPKLIFAVMNQESSFKQRAVSPKGACGYMQLMPGTARRFGVTDIFDPAQNIDAGVKYLRFLLDLFDNRIELALAGYNAGEYRVIRNGYQIPQIRETQNYVRLISANYYKRAGRNYQVTYGVSHVDKKEVVKIERAAFASTDDRGIDMLSNIY